MASNPESHADIIEEMRGNYYKMGRSNARLDKDLMGLMSFTANRLEVAHKREIAELKKKCEEYERQPELMAETAASALELLKAQEAKIAKLRETLRQAVVEYCHSCNHCTYADGAYECDEKQGKCFVQEWRKVFEETK